MLIIFFILIILSIFVSALITCKEIKRQKQMSDDLHYIREVIQNAEKENK